MDTDASKSLAIKRYRSDPSLFVEPCTPSNSRNESPSSDSSENMTSSVRRHLIARRFSTSNVSPKNIMKLPSRINQIKFEESIDKFAVEAAHEKEVQAAINISRSWEQLTLSDHEAMSVDCQNSTPCPDNLFIIRRPSCHSPSSAGRQCISPLATCSQGASSMNASSSFKSSPINAGKRKLISSSFENPAKRLLLSDGLTVHRTSSSDDTNFCEEQIPISSTNSSLLTCGSDDSSSSSLNNIVCTQQSHSPIRIHVDDSKLHNDTAMFQFYDTSRRS